MANKVNTSPSFPYLTNPDGITQWANDALTAVSRELITHAVRLNQALMEDGSEPMVNPLTLPTYTVTTLPTAASWTGAIIYVSNGTASKRLAVSDGTHWRFPDGNIVS